MGLAGCGISLFSLSGCGMKENLKAECGIVKGWREVGSLSLGTLRNSNGADNGNVKKQWV